MTGATHVGQPRVSPSCDPDPRAALVDLENQLYEHVREAIDFGALYQLEQLLWGLLDRRGIADEDGALAKTLLVDAASRATRDPSSYFHVSPPPGITREEEKASQFDPLCPFCQMEEEHAAYAADPETVVAELAEDAALRALYGEAAREWRAKHAEQLARAKRTASSGLGANGHPHEAAGAAP